MVVVSYSGKEINAKLVYYGMGLSGKTTNLEMIYEKVPDTSRGKMVSMKTQSDRTLFFDLLPIDLGDVMGFKTRFLLYTVPGQVFYNATRKLVLKGADAIVMVVDSERGKMDENKESLSNLRANLAEYKVNLDDLPWVLQYNKRDLPDVYTIEEMERELNPEGVPYVEAVASQNQGVMETFEEVSKMLIERVTRDLKRQPATSRPAPSPANRGPEVPPPPKVRQAGAATKTVTAEPVAATAADTETGAPKTATESATKGMAWNGGKESPSYGREVDLPSNSEPKTIAAPAAAKAAAPGGFAAKSKAKPTLSQSAFAKEENTAPAAIADDAESVVVPVKLAPGQKLREIVLRIVIEDESA